uniref:Uncharacterized protein n=1 Tax=Arcella intermedia TaxID=1963864 RepID=A0A6B2L557_9EUKA
MKCYNEILAIDSKSVYGWRMKGSCFKFQNNYEEAIKCYDKAIMIEESDEDWFTKGHILFHNMGKEKESIECFRNAVRINPKNSKAWLNLAKALSLQELQQSKREAIDCFDKFIELNDLEKIDKKECSLVFAGKGRCYTSLGCYKEALEWIDKLISIDASNNSAHSNKGFCLMQLGRLEEALACYKEILKTKMDYMDLANVGNVLVKMGREAEAIEYFNKAIELFPDEDLMAYKLKLLFKLKKFEEAIQFSDTILHINKQNIGVWNTKGMSLQSIGRHKEAIECFDFVLKSGNLNPHSLRYKSTSLSMIGKVEEGILCLKKGLEIENEFKEEDGYLMAYLLGWIGEYNEALKYLEEYPNFEDAPFLKVFYQDLLGESTNIIEQCWNNFTPNKYQWIDMMKQQWKGSWGPFFSKLNIIN